MSSENIPVYEALARDIHEAGIECVFGLMSDDTAQFVTSLDAYGVRFYGARHENNAACMAEGYAAASGKLGIVILGRGPATANGMHGMGYAKRAGTPVLMIIGADPTGLRPANGAGPDRKSFNAEDALKATGVPVMVADNPLTARNDLAKAMTEALNGGLALLLPTNVQQARIDAEATAPRPVRTTSPSPQAARETAIVTASSLLAKARKPLFVVGRGAYDTGAKEAIVALAEHIGAALVTTLKAKDMFAGHPFNCGVLGSFSNVGGRRLIEQADCVVSFGASLNQQTTSYGTALPEELPIIHVDAVRQNIGRWFTADVAVVGDARLVAEQLHATLTAVPPEEQAMRSEENARFLADFRMKDDFQPMDTARTMDVRSAALLLDELLPKDRNLVFDSGNNLMAATYISVPGPAQFKLTTDFASIGMGFGTAMGFAVGAPERQTVFVLGDGSFLMTMGELETVAREAIPLVIILMNDCAYGAELHFLKERDAPVALSLFPDIDYEPVAAAFGFETATVRTLEELRALAPILEKPEGPVFIECKINASVVAPFLLETASAAKK
jgi:thiamine pyrophosphate-dependent acetolactate synthase large subunit-like protein